jgi:hypothetical protein
VHEAPLTAPGSIQGNTLFEPARACIQRCSQSVACAHSYSFIYANAGITTAAAAAAAALVCCTNSALSLL